MPTSANENSSLAEPACEKIWAMRQLRSNLSRAASSAMTAAVTTGGGLTIDLLFPNNPELARYFCITSLVVGPAAGQQLMEQVWSKLDKDHASVHGSDLGSSYVDTHSHHWAEKLTPQSMSLLGALLAVNPLDPMSAQSVAFVSVINAVLSGAMMFLEKSDLERRKSRHTCDETCRTTLRDEKSRSRAADRTAFEQLSG